MYVICFYWQGDRWQQKNYSQPGGYHNPLQHHINRVGKISDDLPAKYINNLYRGVRRFAEEEFKFICFSNENLEVDKGVELRPFPLVSHTGVLPRLWMFSREAGLFGHQVLCLDLDVVIVGNLRDIMGYSGEFCTRRKFKPAEAHKIDGDIMSFRAGGGNEKRFWLPFKNDVAAAEELTRGRERYWIRHCIDGEVDTWQDLYPEQVVSYKWHVRSLRRLPSNARIVSCHGVPRPHEIKDEWIKQYWQ